MSLNAKLGCLKNVERTASHRNAGMTTYTVVEKYACTLLKFDRPEEGVERLDLVCPLCGEAVGFKVASSNRVQTVFLTTALIVSAVVVVLGWLAWTMMPGNAVMQKVGLGLLALGGLGLMSSVIVGLVKPSLFDIPQEALKIARHDIHYSEATLGTSPGRGHKLIQVWQK
jgi:hypothetical protein